MPSVVEVERLRVTARDHRGAETTIIKDVSFEVSRGEVVALIGESGSGKTTIALSLMGYARKGCHLAGGSIRIGGTEVMALSRAELADLRGRRISYIAQSAAASFNPAKRIMTQVVESARIHRLMSREVAEAKALGLFRALALPDPERVGARFPHQVSGGQLQRLMAAMALIADPELVILDEPTTSLDVTTQIEVLRAFRNVVRELQTTAVYVSHDLAVVAQIADRIIVLRDGEIREIGATAALLRAPHDDYTKSLLDAASPTVRQATEAPTLPPPVLEVRGLLAGYGGIDAAGAPRIPVLRDLDFTIPAGSVLGVIGESGCGKSTLARVIAGLLPAFAAARDCAAKRCRFGGRPHAGPAPPHPDRLPDGRYGAQSQRSDRRYPRASSRILPRALGRRAAPADREATRHGPPPSHLAERYPSELSGGQKQRVNLARALRRARGASSATR